MGTTVHGNDEILTDILNTLTDDYSGNDDDATYDQSWRQANILSALPLSSSESSADLARYWSGASALTSSESDISDVQKAQMFIDIVLAKPQLSYEQSKTLSDEERGHIAMNALGSNKKGNAYRSVIKVTDDLRKNTPDNKLLSIYFKLFNLENRALNCLSYWEGGGLSSPPPRFVIARNAEEARGFLNDYDNMEECNKMTCSGIQSQFPQNNKAFDLKDVAAAEVAEEISKLDCSQYRAGTQQNLCQRIKKDGTNMLTFSDVSESMVKSMSSMPTLMQTTQALALLRFQDAISPLSGGSSTTISFSSIYSPNIPTSTSERTADAKLNPTGVSAPNTPRLDTLIDSLAGLETVMSPIRPGLPVHDNSASNVSLMVAGSYYVFAPDTRGNSGLYHTVSQSENGYKIWADAATIDAALSLRTEISNLFYMNRNGLQGNSEQNLLSKSAALDILSEIKTLNTSAITYQNPNNSRDMVTTTGMQALYESSNWRLKGTTDADGSAPWLASVSSMSNTSLLRETAVLLAEMKQLMYLQLSNQQRNLLIQAINTASESSIDSSRMAQLEAAVENYASGSELSSKGPPEAPSLSDIQSQVASQQEAV